MNSARITAEAVIVGKDETGGAFASVSRKMQDMAQKMALVGKAANISAQVERTTAALRQQEAALAAIGKVRAAEQRWEGLNRGAAAAKVKVDQVAAAYAAMAK